MKKYNIIYADPPYAYNESGSGDRVINSKYPTMQLDELKSLPIQNISDENCILFIWVTFPRLWEGLEIIKAGGFEYQGLGFNWVKKNKKKDTPFWGMGYYTRQNPEVCLIGRKDMIKPKVRNVHSVIYTPIEEHSKKPDCVRDKIVEICGDLPRVELFAREKVKGWDSIGFDIDGRDIREVLKGWGN